MRISDWSSDVCSSDLFRRVGGFAALLLCACLPWQQALAADDGTLWRRADQVRHERMQEGADAYRRKDYAGATGAWQALPGDDRSEGRRVGKECGSTCRSRLSPDH